MESLAIIKSAEFVTSAVKPKQYPPALPEVAFAGRSNVGKSSLINSLLRRNKLVRTSRTPGRTQTINFFVVNEVCRFVDLPGYGFARVPESVRKTWGPMVETYITGRESLRGVIQIMDLRHPPTPDDIQLWNWLRECDIPTIPILTKADKIARGRWATHLKQAAQLLGEPPERFILYSSETGEGRDALIERLDDWFAAPFEEEESSPPSDQIPDTL